MLLAALASVSCGGVASAPTEAEDAAASSAETAAEDPPAEEPPAEDPPAEDPPAEDPPAEDPISPQSEDSEGALEAGWHVDGNDNVFYIGEDGEPLTGWQYLNGHWFKFKDDGAATKGWTAYGDRWCYCNERTGAVVANGPAQGTYWIDADGTISQVNGKMAEGGSRSWTEVSGANRAAIVAYLTYHASDYLGTVYSSWPCSVPGTGMHCAGFVDRAIYDAGFGDGFWNNLAGTGYESYFYNDGLMYRADEDPYTNENCWHVVGWDIWMNANDVHWVAYATHEDAMAGAQRGEFRKGDIMIYSTSAIEDYDYSGSEHIALYWGDERDWSLVWESSPEHDNAIVAASEYEMPIYVLTSA